MRQIHATAVALAVDADGPLFGALLLGPPGAGKSLLALEAISACPFRRTVLVADDRVDLRAVDGRLLASGPAVLQGLIEVRGLGPTSVRWREAAVVRAAFDLAAVPSRLPEWKEFTPPEGSGRVDPPPPLLAFNPQGPAPAARLLVAARSVASAGAEPRTETIFVDKSATRRTI